MAGACIGKVYEERTNCQESISLGNRYKITMALPLLSYCMMRSMTLKRTMLFWGALVWFACPEWGLAYLQPKKPLTDLLQDEQSSDEKENATEIFDQIRKKADGSLIDRVTEL